MADLSKDWEEDNDGSAGEGDAEETIESIVNFIQVKKLPVFICLKQLKTSDRLRRCFWDDKMFWIPRRIHCLKLFVKKQFEIRELLSRFCYLTI